MVGDVGLFRRLAGIALEDFGLRRPNPVVAPTPDPHPVPGLVEPVLPVVPVVPIEVVGPAEVDVDTAVPPTSGIIWRGSARRRPELQRFVDHLDSRRDVEPASR